MTRVEELSGKALAYVLEQAGGELRIPLADLPSMRMLFEEDLDSGTLIIHALPEYVHVGPDENEMKDMRKIAEDLEEAKAEKRRKERLGSTVPPLPFSHAPRLPDLPSASGSATFKAKVTDVVRTGDTVTFSWAEEKP